MSKTSTSKILFSIATLFLAGYMVITLSNSHIYAVWLLLVFFLAVAIGFRNYEIIKGYPFTVIGMGRAMRFKDFARVVRIPKRVIAKAMCHDLIMPLVTNP